MSFSPTTSTKNALKGGLNVFTPLTNSTKRLDSEERVIPFTPLTLVYLSLLNFRILLLLPIHQIVLHTDLIMRGIIYQKVNLNFLIPITEKMVLVF